MGTKSRPGRWEGSDREQGLVGGNGQQSGLVGFSAGHPNGKWEKGERLGNWKYLFPFWDNKAYEHQDVPARREVV